MAGKACFFGFTSRIWYNSRKAEGGRKLEAEDPKITLELTGWELEELYQALLLKREIARVSSDIDDFCLTDKVVDLIDDDGRDYCKERTDRYVRQFANFFIEYGRLEQFERDHGWNERRGRPKPRFLTEEIHDAIRTAFERRLTLEIEYESSTMPVGDDPLKTRRIDIYSISKGYIEAYCHFRQEMRVFRADRILSARLTTMPYEIPEGFAPKF